MNFSENAGMGDGRQFRAMTRLSTRANETLAVMGQTCERVPPVSLAPLLASGRIEPADAAWLDLGRPTEDV